MAIADCFLYAPTTTAVADRTDTISTASRDCSPPRLRSRAVRPSVQPAGGRVDDLDVRSRPQEPVDLIDGALGQPRLRRHHREPERRTLPRVLTTDLGSRDVEALASPVEQRPHDLAAVFQRLRIRNPDLHLETDHVHTNTVLSLDMRGVEVPDRDEDFTADPVELFFDLVFVFAFSRLVYLLVHDPTWGGVGEFSLLFMMIWLPWTQFTWSANAVSGNARPVRLLFLVATVASVPMAGSITAALEGSAGIVFAVSLSIILSMALFTMIFGLDRDHPVRPAIMRYSIPNFIAIGLMISAGFLDRNLRIAGWILALLVVLGGTVRAGHSAWLVRPGHFAERHGLIVIVALGEVIVAIGLPVVDQLGENESLPYETVAALVAAGTFAGLLWWAFFDRPLRALEHRHQGLDEFDRGVFARNVYTYAHVPIVAGIILCAAALEEITLHPRDELAEPFRWMLVGGLTLNLGGVVVAIALAFGVIAKERVLAACVLSVVVALSGSMQGLVLLVFVDAVLLLTLIAEHVRVEHRPTRQNA